MMAAPGSFTFAVRRTVLREMLAGLGPLRKD